MRYSQRDIIFSEMVRGVKKVIAFFEIEVITLIAVPQPLVDVNLALGTIGCISKTNARVS